MKKIILILILLSASLNIKSQGWVNQVVVPQPPPLYSVFAYDRSVAWACGAMGSVYYTSNGGTNWVPRSTAQFFNNSVYSIHALSTQIALCVCNVGGVGRIFKTTDAGLSWFNPFSRSNVVLNDIEFINATTGYVYGNPVNNNWFVIKTTDGGNTFDTTSVTRPLAGSPNDIGFPNALHLLFSGGQIFIWFGTNVFTVYRSTNAGINWNFSNTPGNQFVRAITFINTSTGFASGLMPFISTSGGAVWIPQGYPNTGPYLSFTNAAGFLWYTSGSSIYISTNNGSSFIFQYTNPANSLYNHMSFVATPNDNSMTVLTGWAVTGDGVISHYSETVGIMPIGTGIPNTYKLMQNYPNPFNPKTKIQFDIPENSYVILKVYDILGNMVENIYKGQLNAGSYKADFDAGNLSSGVYFYKLQAEDFSETKRMVVIK